MKKINHLKVCLFFLLFLIATVIINNCAEQKTYLKKIPEPPKTNKLRVALVAISDPFYTSVHGMRQSYKVPHETFAKKQYDATNRFLNMRGIYEVAPEEDLKTVLGDQKITRQQLNEDNWAMARQIGVHLYANYIMVVERGSDGPARFFWKMDMINVATGAVFSVHENISGRGYPEDFMNIIPGVYRKLFAQAKSDMLLTAMQKAGETSISHEKSLKPTTIIDPKLQNEKTQSKQPSKPEQTTESVLGHVAKNDKKIFDKTRIVVYDLETESKMNTIALILTEALKEELYNIGKFELVNREDLIRIMEEHRLVESGLVDEKNSVKLGSLLGARENITGRLALFGDTYILSAKRTDIETSSIKSIASIKCSKGSEAALLNSISGLAKRLAGIE